LCADIDAFDLEVACDDPVKLVDLLVALEPTFGGINLEDIKVGRPQWYLQTADNLL
jgi:malate dehydrogenase (oxaloacetate-decarboxylating)(NADP+)